MARSWCCRHAESGVRRWSATTLRSGSSPSRSDRRRRGAGSERIDWRRFGLNLHVVSSLLAVGERRVDLPTSAFGAEQYDVARGLWFDAERIGIFARLRVGLGAFFEAADGVSLALVDRHRDDAAVRCWFGLFGVPGFLGSLSAGLGAILRPRRRSHREQSQHGRSGCYQLAKTTQIA